MRYRRYSIVIPAFNEGARIPAALRSVVECIRARGWKAEVIVVNDGSMTVPPKLCAPCQKRAPEIRLIENPGNRGKGYSVRSGILQARGQIVLFTDAISPRRLKKPSASLPPSKREPTSPLAPAGLRADARPTASPSTGNSSVAASTQLRAE